MSTSPRKFEDKPAVRERVPLMVGLMGPSGSGKTYSALRLARGIQSVTGGDVYGIDTEARRMLHYADNFKFRHIQFDAPFGSLDYLAAAKHCVAAGARIVVVDSMSHEHIGAGGYLQTQAAELERFGGGDKDKMRSWIKPSGLRQQMINGLLQLDANFIFCFRAREKAKPLRKDGKLEIVDMGFMPIAGEELLFEMTVNCLLLPQAGGVPTWRSNNLGERLMIKPAKQFDEIFAEARPLDESIGKQLAEWAQGSPSTLPSALPSTPPQARTADRPAPSPSRGGAGPAGEQVAAMDRALALAAEEGTIALTRAWAAVPKELKPALLDAKDNVHKPRAAQVEQEAEEQ